VSANKLEGVHPDLVERIGRVLAAMAVLGFPMLVTEGLRTLARQQALYAQGRTKPGRIVTHMDGVKKRSKHQPADDPAVCARCA
jgi:peptidoglycan L-alanyl-D-glutamate endopeptidase CwlK